MPKLTNKQVALEALHEAHELLYDARMRLSFMPLNQTARTDMEAALIELKAADRLISEAIKVL